MRPASIPPRRSLGSGRRSDRRASRSATTCATAFVDASTNDDRDDVAASFAPTMDGKWLADLPRLARLRLAARGVADVHASGLCTASDPRRFYSYRRDRVTGRMAALIWIER